MSGQRRRNGFYAVVLAVLLMIGALIAGTAPATALPPNIDDLADAMAEDGGTRAEPELGEPAGDALPLPDLPPLEVRDDPGAGALPTAARSRIAPARSRLLERLGPDGVVQIDNVTGTPRLVARLGSTLTRPSVKDPARIALGYVARHRALFGLAPAELGALELADRYETVTGITTMHWHQQVDGIEFVGNELAANVDGDGRLLNVSGSVQPDSGGLDLTPELSAADALEVAAADAGAEVTADPLGEPEGADSETSFDGGHSARLVLYEAPGGPRLAWEVQLDADSRHYYLDNVDAATGELLSRHNQVLSESARTWDLFPFSHEFGPFGGGTPVLRPLKRLGNGMNDPWRYNTLAPPYNLPFQTLAGNQAFLLLDFNDDAGASANEFFFVRPSDGANNWDFPQQYFNNPPPLLCPPSVRCTWNPVGAFQNFFVNSSQAGTQAYWFVNEFHDHLAAPPIGFTEASGNFELINQDNAGGVGNDDLFLQALDGANTAVGYPDGEHVNNANMLTLPDGQSPIMQMYLFTQFPPGLPPGAPAFEVNGADDAQVVYHEYTHGLSVRLVGGPSSMGGLDGQQSGAMGEGWSDWYATDYLVGLGLLPDNPGKSAELLQGRYENYLSIRAQATDCAVGASKKVCPAYPSAKSGPGGYTYADYGRVRTRGAEVHDDGEIWAQTLWDLRTAMVAKFGAAGVAHTRQLITDGMRLTSVRPSFLDARNGILQADVAATNFNAKKVIWKVFARRGMGSDARSAGPNDKRPKAGFKNPTKKRKKGKR